MPDETAIACSTAHARASSASSSATFGPIVSCPVSTHGGDLGELLLADVRPR